MKFKILNIFFFIFSFISNMYSHKILILEYSEVRNFAVNKIYRDFTEIDTTFFLKNLNCEKIEVPSRFSLSKILKTIESQKFEISGKSIFLNQTVKDYIYMKKLVIIDLKYKILEKKGKRYYIFKVCYPYDERKKSIIKKLMDFLNE